MYPNIEINLRKLSKNARFVLEACQNNGINFPFAVVKVFAGDLPCTKTIIDAGYHYLADSRIENLIKYTDLNVKKVLLRISMPSDIENVIRYSDLSLESEIITIEALNIEARAQKKIHDIILMLDLGDLREGIFCNDNYLSRVSEILRCKNINLLGIGTNLTCYGGVIPTDENMNKLVEIKNNIEKEFQIKLEIISGGNSSSLKMLLDHQLPQEINNLRIGEAIALGRETAYGENIPNMEDDIFTINAELIEVMKKPSLPIGEIGVNAFGEKPVIRDQGMMKRGILALGRQDVYYENLIPLDSNIKIIGQSSDHLIVDLTKTDYHLGDIISFNVNYGGLLQTMSSLYVKKIYIK
ncbi:MAG: ornithine racemase Orr [Bacilli bacterium]|nr:ornithine racemase Orr [Bacilli bacterium]